MKQSATDPQCRPDVDDVYERIFTAVLEHRLAPGTKLGEDKLAKIFKVSRSRIKRLRGLSKPQYRLRVGDVRVFYDVTETTVEILAIVAKLEAYSWLAQFAKPA